MKHVLLTGISGFIGSHMMEHFLVNTTWKITGIASFRHKGLPERILDSKHYQENSDRVKVFFHDLVNPIGPDLIKSIGEVDYIVNCASDSHVDRSLEYPREFVKNNVELMLTMLEYARVVKPEKFIQISTDEVYGPAKEGQEHEEWSTHLPSNPYAGSKACQENLLTAYWRSYGLPGIITNTMNNYGERQDKEKFIPMILDKVSKGETVKIHGTPDNIGSRYWIHARNHADAVLFILKHIQPELYPDTDRPLKYNIVGEKRIDNLAIAQQVASMAGKELKYEFEDFHTTRPGHDPHYGLKNGKLLKAGWEQPSNFEESLRRTIEWETKKG